MHQETIDILDTLGNGSIIIDENDIIVFANRWVTKHLEIELERLQGQPLNRFATSNPWTLHQIEVARTDQRPVVLSQKLHRFLIPIKFPEGHLSGFEYMQQEVIVVPIRGNDRWLHISIRDVTSVVVGEQKLKALTATLKESRIKAEEEVVRKGKFLAMMSHDIRTPMNGILGCAQLLSMSELDETQQMYLDVIQSSGNMLLQLLNEILDHSKIVAGKMKLEKSLFDIRHSATDIVYMFKPEAERKSICLNLEIADTVPSHFYQDHTRFKQVLTNLVSNAVKFTDHGSIGIRISVQNEPEVSKTRLVVSVKDSGVGISESDQVNLFKEFVQAESGFSSATGSGLGLAICKQLCELMDGTISLSSSPGYGSEFTFSVRCDSEQLVAV